MSSRNELLKYQEIQVPADKTGEENNALFSSRFH